MILGELLVAPGRVISSKLKGYALFDCYACPQKDAHLSCWEEARYDSSLICHWGSPVNLFLVNRHINELSADIFSGNECVVDLQCAVPLARSLIWSLSAHTTGHDASPCYRVPGLWRPENSKFLCTFPPACISMLRSLTWHFPVRDDQVAFCEELEADWIHTVGTYHFLCYTECCELVRVILWTRRNFPLPPHLSTYRRETNLHVNRSSSLSL